MFRAIGVVVLIFCVEFPVAENAPQSRVNTRSLETDGAGTALPQIAEVVNAFERNAALYQFVADSDRGRIEALLAEAAGLAETPYRDDIARVLYIRYASLDPAAAVAHALRHRTGPDVLTAVFRAWAHTDLDSAVARAVELPTWARPDAARAILQLDLPAADRETIAERLDVPVSVAEIAEAPTVHGPAPREAYGVVLARLGAMTDDETRRRELASVRSAWAAITFAELDRDGQAMAVHDLGNHLARAEPERAFEWLLELDEELRGDTFEWTLKKIHQQDRALTRRLIEGIADPGLRIEAARKVIGREALVDHAEALRWAETLGEEQQYAPVVGDLFGAWRRWDPNQATNALMRYPRGAARDLALRRFVGDRLRSFDTVGAERFFDAIDSPDARRSAAERLHRYYTETDPNERKAVVFGELATEAD